jgi:aspartate racemase
MKTIGLIGGTTWASTAEYYRIINQETNRRLGGPASAKILLHSVNFAEYQPPPDAAGWSGIGERLSGIALRLEHAGADCLLLCANTMHLVAGQVSAQLRIPLIHIAEVTAAAIQKAGVSKAGLLGTRFTMEQPFYREKLRERGIETIIAPPEERAFIHDSIYTEMARGIFSAKTKERYLGIIGGLAAQGARGVILGCTEIPILVKPVECPVPAFDTSAIHATAAVDFALEGDK